MKESTEILRKYWGYSSFRPPQEEIIDAVLAGRDTVALLPTGAGKSICFQVPALMLKGKTLVISPLIALMQDQVDQLFTRGILAKALHSNLSQREIEAILDNFTFGDLRLLYVAPERLASENFRLRISRIPLSLIAVDESHCISQWGYDFRPAYLNISTIREIHPKTPVIALTATATQQVMKDICARLELQNPAVFVQSFARNNLSLTACITENKEQEILPLVNLARGSAIVYVRNRKETSDLAAWLMKKGISCVSYHGGMEKSDREKNQQAWMTGKVRVIVCTNAFGMGIDKKDVRLVIHLDVPPSLEEYYQEAGRAGRDGKESMAITLVSPADFMKAKSALDDQYPSIEMITYGFEKLCRFYRIAYGAGEQESYDFSLQEASVFLSQPLKKVFHLMQILEKEGWILLSEGLKNPSRITVLADREDLLALEQNSEEKGMILVQLLRSYEGVLTDYVRIDEVRLARILGLEEKILVGRLLQMHAEGMISYLPSSGKPRITFLRPRPQEGAFYIDKKSYLARKKQAEVRLGAMIKFLEEEAICRQAAILTYFGEKSSPCGHCDICLGSLQTKATTDAASRIWQHLKETSSGQMLFIKPYIAQYPVFLRRRVLNLLKHWTAEGALQINNQGKITVSA